MNSIYLYYFPILILHSYGLVIILFVNYINVLLSKEEREILFKLSDDSPEINSMRKTVEEIGRILTYNNCEEKFRDEYKEKE